MLRAIKQIKVADIEAADAVLKDAGDGLSQVNPSRSAADEQVLQRGRDALGRQQFSWDDWIAIGKALLIGQTEVMAKVNADKPHGRRYQKAMDDWLNDDGFKGIDKSIRSRLLECLEHRDEIEQWRATLTEPERLRYNHPNTVLRRWQNSRVSTDTTDNKKTKRKSRIPELEGNVQRLEDENFALKNRIKVVESEKKPDVALFLPPGMPSDARKRLSNYLCRIEQRHHVRCVWRTRDEW